MTFVADTIGDAPLHDLFLVRNQIDHSIFVSKRRCLSFALIIWIILRPFVRILNFLFLFALLFQYVPDFWWTISIDLVLLLFLFAFFVKLLNLLLDATVQRNRSTIVAESGHHVSADPVSFVILVQFSSPTRLTVNRIASRMECLWFTESILKQIEVIIAATCSANGIVLSIDDASTPVVAVILFLLALNTSKWG